jgi:hypothetical protein
MKRRTRHGEYGGYGLGIPLKRRVITSTTRGGIGIVPVDHDAAAAETSMCRVQLEARGRSGQSCSSLYSDCRRSAGGIVEDLAVVVHSDGGLPVQMSLADQRIRSTRESVRTW